jgi:hypothetical protein
MHLQVRDDQACYMHCSKPQSAAFAACKKAVHCEFVRKERLVVAQHEEQALENPDRYGRMLQVSRLHIC